MSIEIITARLVGALTEYDRKQSTKRFYNPHALGIYLERCEQVIADIERGASVRDAVMAGFSDRLRDHILRALGESVATKQEAMSGSNVYRPVTGS